MADTMHGMRAQILANSKVMLLPLKNPRPISRPSTLPTEDSSATLVRTRSQSDPVGDLEVVVFGDGTKFTGAVMVGVTPAIEGAESSSPLGALTKLLTATCELMNMYMPKLGSHQRNIHNGGIFDEDLISQDLTNAT